MTQRRHQLAATAALIGLLASSAFALEEVEIDVLGLPEEEQKALQTRLEAASLTQQAIDEDVTNIQDLIGAARAEYARMLAVLYEQGYYGPAISVQLNNVEVTEIDVFNPPSSVNSVVISVTPGPLFEFGDTNVDPRAPGATENPIVEGFARGEPALAPLVGSAANAGVSEWREEGHAKARVEDEVIIADHRVSELDVDITLEPGRKLTFGQVSITPGSEVSDRRLRQIMGFPTGEVYSPEALRTVGVRLRRSGVFSTVSLAEAEEPNEDGSLDYTLTLIDEKKRRIGTSADYSTLDGLTVGAFWMHRNVFGGGERFRLDGAVEGLDNTNGEGITYRLEGRLTRPGTFGPDNSVYAFFLAERPDEDDYTETSLAFGAGISRHFSDRLYGETALGLRYSEATDVYTFRDAVESGEPERNAVFSHVILPSRLEWDLRNDPGDPTNGAYFNTRVEPFIGLDDSDSGARFYLDARGYLGFGARKGLVLAGRTQIGSIVGSAIDNTPPSFLFYSGGGNTVRGQAFQSLGVPVGDFGQSGGRSFLGASGEIRTKVSKALGLVAFYDYGYVGADSLPGEDGDFHAGAGFGVRYATPIGPIRVDLATPVAGDTRDPYESVELYIGVGQAF
ncbi:MAG: autotransporter assembly complex family protein [Pseudomonadota bacterium]